METLMSLKPDVAKDLLCIIAHGTLKARVSGAHLLFYYWPALNPTLYDRRGVNTKFNGIFLTINIHCCYTAAVAALLPSFLSYSLSNDYIYHHLFLYIYTVLKYRCLLLFLFFKSSIFTSTFCKQNKNLFKTKLNLLQFLLDFGVFL